MNKWLVLSNWQSALGGSWNCSRLFKVTLKALVPPQGLFGLGAGASDPGSYAEGASSRLRKVRFWVIAPIPNIKTREVMLGFPSFLIIFQSLWA